MTDIAPTLQGILDHFSPVSDRLPGQPQTPVSESGPRSPVIFNSTANLNTRNTQLLAFETYVKDLPRQTVRTCTPKYVVNQCDCKRWIVPSVCMCKDCITCASWVQLRTADSLFRRFMQSASNSSFQSKTHTVCYTVFTVPPHIREKFLDITFLKKVRKQVWEILKTKYGALFGVESTHPIGSESDMFAPHLNYLWVQKKGFRPYLDTEELNHLWASLLDVRTVDVWHQYSDKSSQIYKWCKYVGRPFPGYSYWKGSIRWYGKYPVIKKVKDFICPECGGYIRQIGIISAQIVNDFYDHGWLMGLDPPWYNSKNLIPCRGSKKNGRPIGPEESPGLSERVILCSERACIQQTFSVSGDRQGNQ